VPEQFDCPETGQYEQYLDIVVCFNVVCSNLRTKLLGLSCASGSAGVN
jgi:hypothetical protein